MTALFNTPEKAGVIRHAAARHRLRTLVETGSGHGDLAAAVARHFTRVVTIEADPNLFTAAETKLARHHNTEVVFGDSATALEGVLARLDEPCLLWLDAHEVIDGGRSALDAELDVLADQPHRHVILIDDARLCVGEKGWPTLAGINGWADDNGYGFSMANDIVTLVP